MSLRACEVPAVAHGERQRARGDAHAFERDAVAQRMVFGRQVRLDVVRQRVHAGRGGDRRRQVERQLGIGEHASREQLRREDDLLHVRRVVRDHRRAADLRAGAGGRRQRDEIRQLAVDRPHVRMVPCVFEDVARMRRHQRDRLGDVERRAAAQADHRVGACALYACAPRSTWLFTGLPQISE